MMSKETFKEVSDAILIEAMAGYVLLSALKKTLENADLKTQPHRPIWR